MRLVKNKELDKEKWLELLEKSEFSNPFQTQDFYHFYNSIEGFKAEVFAIEDQNQYKALVLVTIQKEKGVMEFFSRRGIIYAGPVIEKHSKSFINELLEGVFAYYRSKLIYIESRNCFDYADFKDQFSSLGFNYIPWLNFHLETSDLNSMKKAMSSSKLRQIKKAIKNGASWEVAKSEEDVLSFYKILSDLYKNKVKKPLFPKDFFIQFYRKNAGKYLLVYYDQKVIGGVVCPMFKNKNIYEMYVCGLDHEFRNLYPSSMATWAAMEFANENKFELFDFMGAGSPEEDYGVREFKSRFGGTQVEHGRFIKIVNPILYNIGKAGVKILSKIKR